MNERIDDLLGRLSTEEKISQLLYDSPAIGLAATFDDDLVERVADAISTEARAKYNEAIRKGNRAQYLGLT